MDLKRLLGLRPKEKTAAALAGTREEIERAARALDERIAAMRRTRGDQLLDGEPEAVERAEAELRAAEEERARLAAMLDALRHREQAAQRDEAVARLRQMVNEANAKAERADQAIRARYPELASMIVREVLLLEREALAALEAARLAKAKLERELRLSEPLDLSIRPTPFTAVARQGGIMSRTDLGAEVRLPGFEGVGQPYDSASPIWPRGVSQ
jgi:hypothetical protein